MVLHRFLMGGLRMLGFDGFCGFGIFLLVGILWVWVYWFGFIVGCGMILR